MQLLLVVGYLRLRRFSLVKYFRWQKIPGKIYPPLVLLSVGATILLDALDRLIGLFIIPPIDLLSELKLMLASGSPVVVLVVFVVVGIAAPFVEESVFRGFIQRTLEKRLNITMAVLWTSLLFTLIHMQPWWFIQLLLMAFFIGYLAWRWDSILPSMCIHAANNLWSLVVIGGFIPGLERYYLWHGQVHPIWLITGFLLFVKGFRRIESQAVKIDDA